MATLLLVIIFIAYISLGIPDSLLGAAWPAIYPEFGLPLSAANLISLIASGCTVVSSLASAKIIHRFKTAKVTAFSTTLTALALLGFSVSGNLLWLCFFAIPLGLGAGAIDAALNNYVALHYRATHMNFLHCFFGIGISLSPYLMSLALKHENSWRLGYRWAFYVQLALSIMTILSLPLWSKAHPEVQSTEEEPVRTLSFKEMSKMPDVWAVCLIFIGSCAIEYTCGIWGSTFLVNSKGMTAQAAASVITFYYIGMTLGRFLSGVLATRLSSWNLIRLGQGLIVLAILLLFLPLPPAVSMAALFLIGLGNGPLFPNLVHLTPQNFGKEISQSVMGIQLASSYVGVMLVPPLFGLLAQVAGTDIFPHYLLILFVFMVLSMVWLIRLLKKQKRYSN